MDNKFKVWDKNNNCWLKATNEPEDDNLFIEEIYESNSGIYEITHWGDMEIFLSTELKDKFEKVIFKGNIIKALNRNYDCEDNREDYFQLFEVTYLNGCYMFGNWNAHEFFNKFMYIEVVGHIKENPELLQN